ncbi:MAG: tyrosine--tRNA ligase [Alphaproteobacteria bacterium]|nr:MAG: tyrosine--tRNA ligase [Alphaproteobacteria bacterium]
MNTKLLSTLKDRGFVYQTTDEPTIDHMFENEKVTVYQGFDATGDSLHVGHLIGIMMLRRLEKAGHQPIVLLGGATTLIGDPSDKEKERPLLDKDTIQKNLESLEKTYRIYLDNPIIVNNADWIKSLNYIDFLREIGRYFSINRMIGFEFVKNRLDNNKPISFLEFNYMILQGYDFYHLFKNHNCKLQIGGSEQWGNIINGVELIHKIAGKDAYGLTIPLLTTSSGTKMGKTGEGKAIWLNADKTSPYDFWQYFRNAHDKDVEKFLKIFTELPLDQIAVIMKGNINEAKKTLADEVTTLLHGADVLPGIHKTVEQVFENKSGNLDSLPVLKVLHEKLLDTLVENELYASRSLAKNGISSGAVKINDEKITDIAATVKWEKDMILTVGRKHHYRIVSPS